jgi:acyl-coenzyme A synthetase/AMP-(fatty) acid ligase
VDLPILPIFALFNPALGLTTIVPEIDPRRPAEVDPAKIVQAIRQENVTNSFGSPTLWRKIGEHCLAQKITLPTLRRVLCAGAPVPAALWKNSAAGCSPTATFHSPYGATEALPVAVSAAETEIEIPPFRARRLRRPPHPRHRHPHHRPVDGPIATLADTRELPPGEIGEIIVRGPVVTQSYDAAPRRHSPRSRRQVSVQRILILLPCPLVTRRHRRRSGTAWATAATSIPPAASGSADAKPSASKPRTAPLHTEPCEQVFRAHPRVTRCALVGLGEPGRQRPALVVEAIVSDSGAARPFARELRALALAHAHTAAIKLFYFHPQFPVDVRHNAKIHRLTLAQWAHTAKGYESDPKK